MLRSNGCWTGGRAVSCLLVSMIVGCASTPDTGMSQEVPFEQNAIQLHLLADPNLNQYEGEAHTLVMCIYQLSNAEAFSKMIQTQDGVVRLLGCGSFDNSVTSSKRIIIHPKEDRTLNLDRLKRTQFVGVVGGYFESTPKKTTRLYTIPIQHYREGFCVWKKEYRWPKKLEVTLHLDSKGLRPDKKKQKKLQVKVPSERS